MIELKGIPASNGIGIGSVMIKKEIINPSLHNVTDTEQEKKRFKDARINSIKQLYGLYETTMIRIGEKEASIFAAHIALIEDEELINGVETSIEGNYWNAEWALKIVTDHFVSIFNEMEDPYLRERALDIKDISNRIQRHLAGLGEENEMETDKPVIIVAHDLTPSDTAQMDTAKVLGFITEIGGKTSHTAILARTLEIPAVVGLHGIVSKVTHGQRVVLDGRDGKVYIEADNSTIEHFNNEKIIIEEYKTKLSQLKYTK
ncbi:MAG: phosphoenolpyruvate--protein phosphotransferase, partial [Firmicutes bacterium HGW-Firmicutes-1]